MNISFSEKAGRVLRCFVLVLAVACIFAGPRAFAAEVSTFGGTEMDGRGQGFSYLALDVTHPLNKVISISGRVMPSYLTYKYYSGETLIKAESPGVNLLGGVKVSVGSTSIGLFAGVETRDTRLHPDDQFASVRGHTTAGTVQGEFDTWITKGTNFNIFASYSGTSNFSYEKGRIKQQVSETDSKKSYRFYAGIEQFLGSNVDFHEYGVGPMVEVVYPAQKLAITVIGGYKHDSTFGDGAYWGLQAYKGF